MNRMSIARSRMLYEGFLPGSVVSHRDGMYALVVGTNSVAEEAQQINPEMLHTVAREFIDHWEATGGEIDQALRDATIQGRLVIRAPNAVYLAPYPLTLECASRRCGYLLRFTQGSPNARLEAIEKRIRRKGESDSLLPCPQCGGPMRQLKFVQVHRCGALTEIEPPYPARGRSVRFHDGGSFFRSYWEDFQTGNNLGRAFAGTCPACNGQYPNRESGRTMRGEPVRGGRGHILYPQLLQYLSLTEETTSVTTQVVALPQGAEQLGRAVVCGLLNLKSPAEIREGLRRFSEGTSGVDTQAALEQRRASLEANLATVRALPGMEETVRLIEQQIGEIDRQLELSRGLFVAADRYIADMTLIRTLAARRRAVEAALFTGEFSARTLGEEIAAADPGRRVLLEIAQERLKNLYGIRDLIHLDEVSIVLGTVGFSRELSSPVANQAEVPVRLNTYIDEVATEVAGRVPAYALHARTEAILVRLDPCRLLAWAVTNLGWNVPQTALADPAEAHACILRSANALVGTPGEVQRAERSGADAHAWAILGVLHSIAHLLVRCAKRGSGYDEHSLSEYLLPADLSVLIYVASRRDYTMGGLRSLFEHSLTAWLEEAEQASINCTFDPICTEEGAACHGCVHIPLGCETFNHGVSRSFLHGGLVRGINGSLTITRGYWDA